MAMDFSSGSNGSVSAERNPSMTDPTAPTQARVLTGETPAEAAARIAAHSIGAPNLTKELAQLLAASISQNKINASLAQSALAAQKAEGTPITQARVIAPIPEGASPAPATPTNAELASLAAIMAGTQQVRKPLPRFRDELATLNYARAPSPTLAESLADVKPEAPAADAATAGDAQAAPVKTSFPPAPYVAQPAQLEAHHDDEPMPIPSTWRQKAQDDEDRPFARQLGAAAMGLAAGLVVVVPAVLWLVGWIGPQGVRFDSAAFSPRASERTPMKVRPIEPPTESATFYGNDAPTLPAADPGAVTTASMARANPIDPTQAIEQVLVMARQKIDGGDVAAAREMLASEDTASPAIAFALAETFDPNMLAAWGSRGVAADVQRARALYTRALDMGYGRAMARLDALQ
jgi:hypothetical protein